MVSNKLWISSAGILNIGIGIGIDEVYISTTYLDSQISGNLFVPESVNATLVGLV